MLPDPDSCLLVVGAKLLDQPPESMRVIVFHGVSEFVQDDIVADSVWHLNQPPV